MRGTAAGQTHSAPHLLVIYAFVSQTRSRPCKNLPARREINQFGERGSNPRPILHSFRKHTEPAAAPLLSADARTPGARPALAAVFLDGNFFLG